MAYPEHKYSKYIDQSFSFNNRVYPNKLDVVDALKNMRCDGNIMLEPRLQEYVKKKKFYSEHNIEPCVSLESEFQISSRDKQILRSFFSGKRDIYQNDKYTGFKKDRKVRKKSFPSKSFRDNDPRVPVIEKQNMEKPENWGMFASDGDEGIYENYSKMDVPRDSILDARDLQNVTGFNLTDTKFNPTTDPEIDPGIEKYNKYASQYRINPGNPQRSADPDPRNKYIISDLSNGSNSSKRSKNRRHRHRTTQQNHQHGVNAPMVDDRSRSDSGSLGTFGNYDQHGCPDYSMLASGDFDFQNGRRYGDMVEPTFSEKSDMDFNNKVVVPKVASNNKKELDTSAYQMMPFFNFNENNSNPTNYQSGDTMGRNFAKSNDFSGLDRDQKLNTAYDSSVKDADVETSMIRGMPSRTTKSYGYRNPYDHYFDFVEDDYQNPDNTVLPFPRGGESTRLQNKKLASQKYTREIM